ncbi:MAG: DUF1990 domain-containing protein [Bacteroidetes bacterium]|nr:MAG: DUF1990 domain-containing protein [Bacteroidota bacterium]
MVATRWPVPPKLEHFLATQSERPFTYPETGATRSGKTLPGFDNDLLRVEVGQGTADFEQAKAAIRQWQMFPEHWTRILPAAAPIETGTTVAMYARYLGFWWRNACRIVYTVDMPRAYGFAYGTLPGHIERGEELFLVELEPDGTVWYEIRAFSRPRHLLARLGYPLVRGLQARFRRDSARQMRAFVQTPDPVV